MAQKNIVEKYIEMVGQFIILISGLPGCGKQELGENLERDLKFKLLNTYHYNKTDYDDKIKLTNPENEEEIELINWYTDDAIDWDKLNNDINKYKKDGVIVIGMSLPKDKINSESDYHIHLNISKQISMEKIQKYINKHQDKYADEFKLIGTPFERLKMNKLIFPYYLETTKMAKINKYITIKEMNDDEVYDMTFDLLMQYIQGYLDKSKGVKNGVKNEVKNIGKKNENMDISVELLDEPKYSYDDDINLIKKIEGDDSSDEYDSDELSD
jgi:cytidylate kinase